MSVVKRIHTASALRRVCVALFCIALSGGICCRKRATGGSRSVARHAGESIPAQALAAEFRASFGDDFDITRTHIERFVLVGSISGRTGGTYQLAYCEFSWNTSADEGARHGSSQLLVFLKGKYIGHYALEGDPTSEPHITIDAFGISVKFADGAISRIRKDEFAAPALPVTDGIAPFSPAPHREVRPDTRRNRSATGGESAEDAIR